jgi:hypothetical protein
MSTAQRLLRPRREKMFGEGRLLALDRNAKARITAKFLAVLDALIWGFHNAATGRCFPAYETIAERAGCTRSTVYQAIHALEAAGLLTWVNRIKRVREWGEDLFGRSQCRIRVVRTSNAYTFVDPKPSKSELLTGTAGQFLKLEGVAPQPLALDPANRLHRALMRLERALKGAAPSGAASLPT